MATLTVMLQMIQVIASVLVVGVIMSMMIITNSLESVSMLGLTLVMLLVCMLIIVLTTVASWVHVHDYGGHACYYG